MMPATGIQPGSNADLLHTSAQNSPGVIFHGIRTNLWC